MPRLRHDKPNRIPPATRLKYAYQLSSYNPYIYPGWLPILEQLFSDVESCLNSKEDRSQFQWAIISEEYGRLNLRYNFHEYLQPNHRHIQDAILSAKVLSAITSMQCGCSHGSLLQDTMDCGQHYLTVCGNCLGDVI